MGTTLEEFRRRVFLNLKRNDGETNLAFEQAINDAHRAIARVCNFDEMIVLNTANATTAANTGEYGISANWGITNLKDIISLRYIDANNSRKLLWLDPRTLDLIYPYKLEMTQGVPKYYTRRGANVELLPVPGANQASKAIHITYAKWPTALSNETDQTEYENLDDVIIQLATEMTDAYCSGMGGQTNWTARAIALLQSAAIEEMDHPDQPQLARETIPNANNTGRIPA